MKKTIHLIIWNLHKHEHNYTRETLKSCKKYSNKNKEKNQVNSKSKK